MSGDKKDEDQLDPKAKLLIQKYVLALVAGFGTVALAVLAIIGASFFSAIETKGNDVARKAVETELERKKADFAKLESEFSKLTDRVDRQAATSAANAEKAQAQVNAILASASEAKGAATAEIAAAKRRAEDASADAQRKAADLINRSEEIQEKLNALLKAIAAKSPEVATELRKYSEEFTSTTKRLGDSVGILTSQVAALYQPRPQVAKTGFVEMQASGAVDTAQVNLDWKPGMLVFLSVESSSNSSDDQMPLVTWNRNNQGFRIVMRNAIGTTWINRQKDAVNVKWLVIQPAD